MKEVVVLDVRDLPAPEPLEKVLAMAEQLQKGNYFILLHRMEPCLLFPILKKNGFQYQVKQKAPDLFEIIVWHADEPGPS